MKVKLHEGVLFENCWTDKGLKIHISHFAQKSEIFKSSLWIINKTFLYNFRILPQSEQHVHDIGALRKMQEHEFPSTCKRSCDSQWKNGDVLVYALLHQLFGATPLYFLCPGIKRKRIIFEENTLQIEVNLKVRRKHSSFIQESR